MKRITISPYVKTLRKKGISYLDTAQILSGTLVTWNHKKQEDMMVVNTIIVTLLGFIAILAVMAWMLDHWRNNDDDDDFEPYG